jgi:hypothetical protein
MLNWKAHVKTAASRAARAIPAGGGFFSNKSPDLHSDQSLQRAFFNHGRGLRHFQQSCSIRISHNRRLRRSFPKDIRSQT